MADKQFQLVDQKLTPAVDADEVIAIDSEDWQKLKRMSAVLFKGSQGDVWPQWPQGDVWPTWPQWPQGDVWPEGPAWADWLNWKGAYDWWASYVISDAVSYNWSSYIAIADWSWNLPTDTNFWNLLAEKWADWDWSGDMLKSTYDPNTIEADAFSMDNMVETSTKKILSDTERTDIANNKTHTTDTTNPHSVTQAQVGLGNVDNTADLDKPISTATQSALDWKEDSFTKNTAFNKNFWTAAGDVLEGNTDVGIVGTKAVDETNLADWNAIQYDEASWKYKSVPFPTGWGLGWIETVLLPWVQVAGTTIFEYVSWAAHTVSYARLNLQVLNEWADFIVEGFVNWVSQWTLSILTTATATNGRYSSTWSWAIALVADDVFTVKITQVGTTVAWSDLSFDITVS